MTLHLTLFFNLPCGSEERRLPSVCNAKPVISVSFLQRKHSKEKVELRYLLNYQFSCITVPLIIIQSSCFPLTKTLIPHLHPSLQYRTSCLKQHFVQSSVKSHDEVQLYSFWHISKLLNRSNFPWPTCQSAIHLSVNPSPVSQLPNEISDKRKIFSIDFS